MLSVIIPTSQKVADCGWSTMSSTFKGIMKHLQKLEVSESYVHEHILQCLSSRAVRIPEARKVILTCSYLHNIHPSDFTYLWW
mmetsp:Transcript_4565/g.11763  ORF Transcript_4565/g.11763 Transcript_4565/m.11763 type:complete len:83 (+) Transcript_4565:301-549(+)